MVSRCKAECQSCKWYGSRSETFVEKSGTFPAFDDVCPRCHGNNVDVISIEFEEADNAQAQAQQV